MSKMKQQLIIVLVMGTVISGTISASTSYVVTPGTAGVTPTANYTSWATAATNIQDAIDVVGSGGLVLVTNGTYTLDAMLELTNGITLRSFTNDSVDRDGTIINGNYLAASNRCVYLSGVGTVMDGFTVTNGYALDTALSGNGGGVYIDQDGTVTNCLIAGNEAGVGGGGGIYLNQGGLVTMSTISGNVATNANAASGGGVYFFRGGVVTNCLIKNNCSNTGAGVMMIGQPLPDGVLTHSTIANNESLVYANGQGSAGIGVWFRGTIENCSIISNKITRFSGTSYGAGVNSSYFTVVRDCLIAYNTGANYGGGIIVAYLSTVSNCMIRNNSDGHGAGVLMSDGGVMQNCTIINNSNAAFVQGGTARNCLFADNDAGLNVFSSAIARFENCTVAGNQGVGMSFRVPAVMDNCIVSGNNSGGDNWSYSEIGTNTVWTNSCTTPMLSGPNDTGNITDLPLFKNTSAGNYHLTRASLCVNAGVDRSWMTGAVDLDGEPRLVGTVDMGAYELPPPLGTCIIIQ